MNKKYMSAKEFHEKLAEALKGTHCELQPLQSVPAPDIVTMTIHISLKTGNGMTKFDGSTDNKEQSQDDITEG